MKSLVPMTPIERFFYLLKLRLKNLYKLFFTTKFIRGESYFPEYRKDRKSKLRMICDQFVNIIKHAEPNNYYFLYGLDIKHREDNYVDYSEFMYYRERLNNPFSPMSTVGILRNKFFFGIVAETLGISVPENVGIISGGEIFILKDKSSVALTGYLQGIESGDFFVKDIDGECGDGVYHLVISDGSVTVDGKPSTCEEFCKSLGQGTYLMQRTIVQHRAISNIFSKSINTIRVETVRNIQSGEIEFLPPLLRVGTGDNNVDNWAAGGLAIGIDLERYSLAKYGFYKPKYGTKATHHPNTGVEFEGYEIPYMMESLETVKRFHNYFKDIHSIGWDIAITEDGPVIIEGNDNWEISLVQICSHGLQGEFDSYFKGIKH